jgi:hypothetical protein
MSKPNSNDGSQLTPQDRVWFENFNRIAREDGMPEATVEEWKDPDALNARADSFHRDQLVTEIRTIIHFKSTEDLIKLAPKLIRLSRYDKGAAASLCRVNARDPYLRALIPLAAGISEGEKVRDVPISFAAFINNTEQTVRALLGEGKINKDRHDQVHMIGTIARAIASHGVGCLSDILSGFIKPMFLQPPRTLPHRTAESYDIERRALEIDPANPPLTQLLESAQTASELIKVGSLLVDGVRKNPLSIECQIEGHCRDHYLSFTAQLAISVVFYRDGVADGFLHFSDAQADAYLADGRITRQRWEFIRIASVLSRAISMSLSPKHFQSLAHATIGPPIFSRNTKDAA